MIKNAERLATRYAKALLEITLEMSGDAAAQEIEKQLGNFTNLEGGEAATFFKSPVFDTQEKVKVLEKVLASETVDPALDRFLRVLIQMGHIELLIQIAAAYTEALREYRNETEAKIRTAFPLNDQDRNRIVAALSKATGKTVTANVAIDKGLIGGVVAEVGGVLYDASIQGYLTRLAEEFAV